MADTNKVEFGISELHFCTYEDNNGTVTLGTPFAEPGAVSLTLEPQGDSVNFYADNVAYWARINDNGFTGTLTVAKFSDTFKKSLLGYVELDDGGIAQLKGVNKPSVCLMFESDGDADQRRGILYNVTLGNINRSYNTETDTVEVDTESIEITVVGDNTTKIVKASYDGQATGYATLFTNPPVPALPASL